MITPSSHQRLNHAHHNHFLAEFGEKRRIFVEGPSYTGATEAIYGAPFYLEAPSSMQDIEKIQERVKLETSLLEQVRRRTMGLYELEALLERPEVAHELGDQDLMRLKSSIVHYKKSEGIDELELEEDINEEEIEGKKEGFISRARKSFSNLFKNQTDKQREVSERSRIEMEQWKREMEERRKGIIKERSYSVIREGASAQKVWSNKGISEFNHPLHEALERAIGNQVELVQRFLHQRVRQVQQEVAPKLHAFRQDDPIGPQSTLRKLEDLSLRLTQLDERGLQNAAKLLGINVGNDPNAPRGNRLLKLAESIFEKAKGIKKEVQDDASSFEKANESREELEELAREKIERKIEFLQGVTIEQLDFFRQLCEGNIAEGTKKENTSNAKYFTRLIQLIQTTELRQGTIDNHQGTLAGLKSLHINELQETADDPQYVTPFELADFPRIQQMILDQNGLSFQEGRVIRKEVNKTAVMGEMAGKAITQTQEAQTPGEIIEILSNTIGKDKFEITQNFKNYPLGGKKINLESYTSNKGGMVFYDHGADSKIIIDAQRLYGEGIDQKHLVNMITHELRHVKLEHTPHLKKRVMDAFESHPKWGVIQKLFKKLGKRPPYGTQWTPEAIAHEIYAMRNDLGKGKTTKAAKRKYWNNQKKLALFKLNDLLHEDKFYEETIDSIDHPEVERSNLLEQIGRLRGAEEGVGDEDLEQDEQEVSESENDSSQEETEGGYEKNRSELDKQKRRIPGLKRSPKNSFTTRRELRDIENFLKEVENENEELRKKPSKSISKLVEAAIEKAKEGLTNVDNYLNESDEERYQKGSFFSRMRHNTNFISIKAIVEGIKSGFETYKRRQERNDKEGGERGVKAVMGNTAIGQEAASNLAKIEDEQVNDWKFDADDPWAMEDRLEALSRKPRLKKSDKHQLKALMRALAAKGMLNFQSPNLLRALNKVQGAIRINPYNPEFQTNQVLLDNVLKKAIGAAYDLDEYPDLLRKTDSSYNSKKNEFFEVHRKDPGGLTKKMETALINKLNGDEKIDPIEYESIIEYCIKEGKSEPDFVIFHLIAGVASGILRPNRVAVLNDLTNNFPSLDYILDIDPQTQQGFKRLCEKWFPTDFKRGKISDPGQGKEFEEFYFTEIGNYWKVLSRTEASVVNRSWDHDHAHGITGFAEAEALKTYFGSKSGEPAAKDTAKDNHLVGLMRYIELNANNYNKLKDWKGTFTRIAASVAMTDGMFSGVAYPNEKRSRYGNKRKKPREGSMGNHPDWVLGDYQKKMKNFLFAIDPIFYGTLLDENIGKNQQKRQRALSTIKSRLTNEYGLGGLVGQLNTLDDVFDRISNITQAIVGKNEGALQKAVTQVAATKKVETNVVDINTRRRRGRLGRILGGRRAA